MEKRAKGIILRPIHTPNLFRNGFLPLLESGDFSDVVLIVGAVEYKVHRLILAYSSEFFAHAFRSRFIEGAENRLEVKLPDPRNRIKLVLQYMYEGVIDITEENQLDLLAVADHFLMNELKTVVMERILQHTGVHNALDLLIEATKIKADPIIDECLHVITKYFAQTFASQDLSVTRFDHFLRIMLNNSLQVRDETQVYNKVTEYVHAHPELTAKEKTALFGGVRYRWLNRIDLQAVAKNPNVPRQYLVEALMEKLQESGVEEDAPGVLQLIMGGQVEERDASEPSANKDRPAVQRLQKRPDFAIHFEYMTDFDEGGIIHYISTEGETEEWSNPAIEPDSKLKITASSIEKGAPHNIVAKEPTECWTKDVPASWFAIDFGVQRRCRCTAYTLRHGGNYRADSLRNWDIQGSNDGEHWTLLKRHTNDLSLGSNYATATWRIPTEKQAHKFRIFRILQTGHNSSNHNFLVLSGIELYGHLYEAPKDERVLEKKGKLRVREDQERPETVP